MDGVWHKSAKVLYNSHPKTKWLLLVAPFRLKSFKIFVLYLRI